jgi:uncharacterized membrane protein YsdA (DUF1294 family)
MLYLIIYLIIINLVSFFAYRIDKKRSEKGKWRIKESTLLLFSFFGGGIGSMFGMNIYHHKTKKLKFKLGVPLLTIISIVLIVLIINVFE